MINFLSKKIMTKLEISILISIYVLIIMILGGLTVLKIGFRGSVCNGNSMENTIGNNYKLLSVSTSTKRIERGNIVSIKVYTKEGPMNKTYHWTTW